MFLQLEHTGYPIFIATKNLVLETYRITKKFPPEERFNLTSQTRRAALSTHLNVCEGFSRRSKRDRCRFFEVSRGSVVETDTAFDIAQELEFTHPGDLHQLGLVITDCFYQLTALIRSTNGDDKGKR